VRSGRGKKEIEFGEFKTSEITVDSAYRRKTSQKYKNEDDENLECEENEKAERESRAGAGGGGAGGGGAGRRRGGVRRRKKRRKGRRRRRRKRRGGGRGGGEGEKGYTTDLDGREEGQSLEAPYVQL